MAKKPAKAASGSKVDDLRTKSDDQLGDQLVELKREAFNLRFQAATNQLERPARIREVRRDIARIKTLQNERNRAAEAK
jgi:large subunit ribosomal protein L29